MIRQFFKIGLGLILLSVVLLPCAFADPILSIQPPSTSVAPGNSFMVDVNIANVTDLFVFGFDIGFNPSILSAVSVTEGSFVTGVGVTFFQLAFIDNTGGTIAPLFGLINGVSGSGTLAVLDFTALSSGTSPIDILNVALFDSSLSPITSSEVSGAANVGGRSVPEPPTLLLLLAQGVAASLALKWRRLSG